MATRKQVSCINKRADHYNAHERIENIGGLHNGARWKMSENAAIFNIKYNLEEYYVSAGGKAVKVIIATHNGNEYLKTEVDGYVPNNLLNLPECPAI